MEEQKKISINLPPNIAEGVYANLALISHSQSEFIIDFIRSMPGVPSPTVMSRVIMTPDHAKELLAALKENIEKYETNIGPIATRKGNSTTLPFGFSGKGDA